MTSQSPLPEWFDLFVNPPARYRTQPQWSLNGELSSQRIREHLQQNAANGVGGFFAHARPGHITGYLSERFFQLWDESLRTAKRLGMEYHIYDEFTCPGGHAGGHVIASKPHLVQRSLVVERVTDPRQLDRNDEVLACFATPEGDAPPRRLADDALGKATPEAPVLAAMIRAPRPKRSFPMPDLLLPETCQTFIQTTHDQYARHSGDEFGDGVRFMFCDEPHVKSPLGGWPISRYFLKEFRLEHEYDLVDRLGELLFDQGGSAKVRYDWLATFDRLFNANFMKPLHDWCEAHGLLFTGHIIENAFPRPMPHPDNMSALRWMQAPGCDLLGFQFESTCQADNALYFLNLKEMTSIAAQMGREWVLVESCGGPGYQCAFELFKPCEDYLLATGTNVMDPHLAHQSLAGIRKYDFPQTLSDHSPWWPYYHHQANHVARANAALCQGSEPARVGVLHPTTSTWLHWTPADPWVPGKPKLSDALKAISQSMYDLLLSLYGSQADFELISELVLAEIGGVDGAQLVVGERAYDVVILPAGMENWTSRTLARMEEFLAAGGKLWSLRDAPTHLDGEPSDAPSQLLAGTGSVRRFGCIEELVQAIREEIPPRLSGPEGEPLPGELCWRRVDLDDGGAVCFFANPWQEPIEAKVLLAGASAMELDTATGEHTPLPVEVADGGLIAELSLPPRGHALWLTRPAGEPHTAPAGPTYRPAGAEVELRATRTDEPNRLLVDYCDLDAGQGRTWTDVCTFIADKHNWRAQGFECNLWLGHQLNRNVADHLVDPRTGFAVTYRFEIGQDVDEATMAAMELAIERPWLYEVRLNGRPIDPASGRRWFDEDMRTLPAGEWLRRGQNVLTLSASPFETLCEIMPVYLLGDVRVVPADRGFVVAPASPIELGDWTSEGLPFYPAGVCYDFAVTLAADADAIDVRLGRWDGSVVDVSWDGQHVGDILHPPFALRIDAPAKAGVHSLSLKVIGNMRNMMGPHLTVGTTGPWSYEYYPEHQPSGRDYAFYPSGLHEAPAVLGLTTA